MDIKDLKGLMEAYSEVYAPQEVDEATAMAKRGYDETKLRKRAGGGEAADRATALEKRPTYGDAKKAKQRSEYARKQRGDFRNTASSSPGLHGYGHQSNDPKVKAKQAARGAQRGALTPNEKKQLNMEMEYDVFDVILEFLYVEGYAETLEEAEWMMANLIDEEAIDIILGEEQLDEVLDTPEKANEYARKNVRSMLGAFAKGVANKDISQLKTINKRTEGARRAKRKAERNALRQEDFELWVNELVEEGYDLSDYTWEEMFDIYEAEGSYGQTPKAREAMGKLAIARRSKPASEYSQKGEKTKKVKSIEKHTRRIDNGPDVGNRGKKSTKPRHSGFLGKSGRGKMDQDRRDDARDSAVEYTAGGHKPGSGTVTKNPKKLRKQKAMGEIGERFEAWLDEAMSNYEKNRKRAAQRAAARNAARDQGKTGAVPGVGYVTPRRERETWTDESGKTRHAKGL